MASGFRLVVVVSLVLAASISAGMANAGEPIPGVDIELGKNPDGTTVVVATTGREGRFSSRVRVEPGEYAVTTVRAPRRPCPANRQLTLDVDGRAVRPDSHGRYLFPVGAGMGTVMISGRLETLDRVSAPR